MLNADWARFFKQNNFLIGISLDGPEDLHNALRYTARGAPVHDKVLRNAKMLVQEGVEVNILAVVSRAAESMPEEIYEFIKLFAPLRFKGALYEGGIRTPLIAWWPGKIQAGRKSSELTASWDFLATAAELGGTAAPRPDGVSLVPTLLGQGNQTSHQHLYWEKPTPSGLGQAVRRGPWKLIRTEQSRASLSSTT